MTKKSSLRYFNWAVIGAGPAGIIAVGKLLDAGIAADKIVWIDPEFTVGDIGKKWYDVHSNTKVKSLLEVLTGYRSFNYSAAPDFLLNKLQPEQTCQLSLVAQPLQWISNHLTQKVTTITDSVNTLSLYNKKWHINLNHATVTAKQVVLATGSHPKKLSYPIEEIPLETVLNREKLSKEKLAGETIAVFGASHSAIIALENLLNCHPEKVINIYKYPIKYAVEFDNFTLFDNTGLKGNAAEWAKTHIDGTVPDNLERIHFDDQQLEHKLQSCSRVVYAIGFKHTRSFTILPYPTALNHNDKNGIIAPGLFGLGVAYPNKVQDPLGNIEYDVGIKKFMKHINNCFPVWLQYHI